MNCEYTLLPARSVKDRIPSPAACLDDIVVRSKGHYIWWLSKACPPKKVVETEKTLDNWLECSINEMKIITDDHSFRNVRKFELKEERER